MLPITVARSADAHRRAQESDGTGMEAASVDVAQAETVGRPMEILMVEDSISDARLAIEALRRGKIVHRMSLVRDGDEAIRFVRREGVFARSPRPDLVLLDIGLPKKDGRQVLAVIKSDPRLHTIPVVVMTACHVHEDTLKSQLPNIDCYMPKPVDLDKFLNVVRQLKTYWRSDVILPDDDTHVVS